MRANVFLELNRISELGLISLVKRDGTEKTVYFSPCVESYYYGILTPLISLFVHVVF